jgi:hypothetical protein
MNYFLPLEANITGTASVGLVRSGVSTKLLYPFEAFACSHGLINLFCTGFIEGRKVRIDFSLNVF